MNPQNRIALIPIDIQNGFNDPSWGTRNNPEAEKSMNELLNYWREKSWSIFHVQHLSKNPNSTLHPSHAGVNFMGFARPIANERVIQKSVNSAFIGTDLERILNEAGIKEIIFMGLTSDHCVSTSARMAANLGFKVSISAETVCTFDRTDHEGAIIPAKIIHQAALASLHEEFATIHTQKSLFQYLDTL